MIPKEKLLRRGFSLAEILYIREREKFIMRDYYGYLADLAVMVSYFCATVECGDYAEAANYDRRYRYLDDLVLSHYVDFRHNQKTDDRFWSAYLTFLEGQENERQQKNGRDNRSSEADKTGGSAIRS